LSEDDDALVGASEDSDDEAWFAHDTQDKDLVVLGNEKIPSVEKHKWIADTGATSHMTGDRKLVKNLRSVKTVRKVKTGGGRLDIEGVGTVKLIDAHHSRINLVNVLYVPGLSANLLSVRALCKRGMKGHITEDSICFYYGRTLMMKAVLESNLYIVKWFAKSVEEYALTTQEIDNLLEDNEAERQQVEAAKVKALMRAEEAEKLYHLWHRRLGHFKKSKLRSLHEITDIKAAIPINTTHRCEVCDTTKMVKKSSKTPTTRKDDLLELVSFDICGPFPTSINGNKYLLEGVDNSSRKSWSLPIPDRKSVDTVLDRWKAEVELQSGRKLQAIRIDNARELIKETSAWRDRNGIELQTTIPYTSHQNGVAEREIRITEEGMRALLKDSALSIEFWDEAAVAHNYIRNRVEAPRSTLTPGEEVKTPEEMWTGKPPIVSHMRVWGCKTISYVDPRSVPKSNDKLVDRGREGVFVGYVDATTKHYRVYAPDRNAIITASTIKFYEDIPGGTIDLRLKKATPGGLPERQPVGRPKKQPKQSESVPIVKRPVGRPRKRPENTKPRSDVPASETQDKTPIPEPIRIDDEVPISDSIREDVVSPMPTGATAPINRKRAREDTTVDPGDDDVRRSKRLRDRRRIEEAIETAMTAAVLSTSHKVNHLIPLPSTYDAAINDPVYGPEWHEAIRTEVRQLIANGTFREVQKPHGVNVVTAKWVFAVKYAPNGGVERFKARLVARGFSQVEGIDFKETFAPTIRADSLRILLAIIALEDLEAHQVDVNNAFTEAKLNETIYMKPPDGVECEDGMVC
jgi:transposase InsO family protein